MPRQRHRHFRPILPQLINLNTNKRQAPTHSLRRAVNDNRIASLGRRQEAQVHVDRRTRLFAQVVRANR